MATTFKDYSPAKNERFMSMQRRHFIKTTTLFSSLAIASFGEGLPSRQRPRVLVAVGDNPELMDTLYPLYRLFEAGFKPVLAASSSVVDLLVMNEPLSPDHARRDSGCSIEADVTFSSLVPDEYVGLYITGECNSGGEFGASQSVIKQMMIRKPVAVVRAGATFLMRADCAKGRRIAAPPCYKTLIERCHGCFDALPFVVDHNLVSSLSCSTDIRFMNEWLRQIHIGASCGTV